MSPLVQLSLDVVATSASLHSPSLHNLDLFPGILILETFLKQNYCYPLKILIFCKQNRISIFCTEKWCAGLLTIRNSVRWPDSSSMYTYLQYLSLIKSQSEFVFSFLKIYWLITSGPTLHHCFLSGSDQLIHVSFKARLINWRAVKVWELLRVYCPWMYWVCGLSLLSDQLIIYLISVFILLKIWYILNWCFLSFASNTTSWLFSYNHAIIPWMYIFRIHFGICIRRFLQLTVKN